MTVPLSPGSARMAAAKRFATALRAAMARRKVGTKRLAEATGCAPSAISNWRAAANLPTTATAARLAEVLGAPALVRIAEDGRRLVCARCGRSWVHQGGGPARFCSADCREIHAQLARPAAGTELAAAVGAALPAARAGGLVDWALETALARYVGRESRRAVRRDRLSATLDATRALIDAMCRSCEPDGVCRTADCPLRPASPLPLGGDVRTRPIREVVGAWGPSHRERTLAAVRAASEARWSRPGERERAGEQHRARHAGLSEEEQAAWRQRISAGRRRTTGERRPA